MLGVWFLEQPASSLMPEYNRMRDVIRMLRKAGIPVTCPQAGSRFYSCSLLAATSLCATTAKKDL